MISLKKIAAGALLAVSLVACNNTTHSHGTTTVHGGSGCHNVVTTSHHRQKVTLGKRTYYKNVTTRSTHVVCH